MTAKKSNPWIKSISYYKKDTHNCVELHLFLFLNLMSYYSNATRWNHGFFSHSNQHTHIYMRIMRSARNQIKRVTVSIRYKTLMKLIAIFIMVRLILDHDDIIRYSFSMKLEYHKFLLWICTVLNILHTHASVVILKRNSGVASDLLLQSPTFASNRNLSSSMHDLSNKMSCIYRYNLYFPSFCLI